MSSACPVAKSTPVFAMSLSSMFLNFLFFTFLLRASTAPGASFTKVLVILLTVLFLAAFLPKLGAFLKILLKPLPCCQPATALLFPRGAALCL